MLEFIFFLNSILPLTPAAQADLLKLCRHKKLRKGQYWLKAGDICEHVAFIKKGLMKVHFDCGSKENCLWYNKENDVVLSVASFYGQAPSSLYISCAEDTEIATLHRKDIEWLYEKYPELNFHSRKLLEHYYSLSETHVRLLMLPPKERYDMLLRTYPWMFGSNRIKEKMLAAYIGVTPETFSNYRNGK